VDAVAELETALGAELLRAELLGASRPRIGQRYTIDGFLGRGATGLVVAAQDERLGRAVALKLSIGGAEATGLAEARALARLDHPNVVRVFDVLVADQVYDGKPFRLWVVAMQKVPGRSLRVWLKEKHRSTQEIVGVFLSAGAGLAAAHAEKIVHRDFKPDNVLVRTDGIAQVIDFGFAVPAASSKDDGRAFPFEVAGTDAYMSPEAKKGRPTARSDQYAFAIALVEALTGVPEKPGFFTPPGVPRATWKVLRRATRTAARRYPKMTVMLRELDASRRPSTFWPRLRRSVYAVAIVGAVGYWASSNPEVAMSVARRLERAVLAAAGPEESVTSAAVPLSLASTRADDEPDATAPRTDPPAPAPLPGAAGSAAAPPATATTVSCDGLAGTHELRTRADGFVGCWRVTVADPATCEAQFEKYASTLSCNILTDDPTRLATVRLEPGEDGVRATVPVLGRTYRFFFPDTPESLRGSVEIESDGVVVAGRVSHIAPFIGHDARRPE
jgi:serine/threonine protein kinase